jgi:hypothetical protein
MNFKNRFQVILDKGTFDAIALNENKEKNLRQYTIAVHEMLNKEENCYFVITSCNFTKVELIGYFSSHFKIYSQIKYPTFKFGGKEGTVVTTIALQPNTEIK